MRSETLGDDPSKFDEWVFSSKRGIRAMSKRAYDMIIKYEKKDNDNAESEDILDDEDEKRSAELYDILCQYCSGEALMIVRSVADMEGHHAWQRLYKKYNPRLMSRGLRILTEAVNPTAAKDLANVDLAIAKWEEKVKMLKTQF